MVKVEIQNMNLFLKKKDLWKGLIYVKYTSKEILKQFSKSKILNMAWNPGISTET